MQPEAGAPLWDAAEAAGLVHEFVGSKTEAEFNSDLIIRSAIERQLEILGEALNAYCDGDINQIVELTARSTVFAARAERRG